MAGPACKWEEPAQAAWCIGTTMILRRCRPRLKIVNTPCLNSSRTMSAHTAYNAAAFLVTGSFPPFGEIRSLGVGSGRFYSWDDQREARRVAFLGSDAAKQLFPQGDGVNQSVYLNNIP